ncbi:NAD(P)-binding protein [Aspergillus uvarum CBS 121591]|uniref:NAD(P)-binding protein n=1 Tax=Aspergillus uvarum CBS 121591 TaxID=1448315 RepID=A0A319C589_9EURO|nr:NAD(P)-binding protein [Aspergillus uvarum CBS 121591]PYH80324.1 NAD(P)-binding protein [Aspergillus uvarum CBS 121591]
MPGCALVTGCSAGGIGSALVEELHAPGMTVYATARSPAKMEHLAKLPNVTLVALDVVDPISLAAAVNTVRQDLSSHGDTLDILVNNAGQSLVYPALDTSIDKAKCFHATLLLVPDNGSTIVNVCSISGFLYAPWMSVYNASKAALMSWSETLRLELQPYNVRVISLVTGTIATNIMSHANLTLPESSLYHKALPEIQTRGAGKDVLNKSAPDDFARQVVQDILGGASGPVWRGAMASLVEVVSKYIPTGILDRAMKRGTGLDKLS